MGTGMSGAPLIEQDYPVDLRVEKSSITRLTTSPWTAMDKDNGDTLRVATFLYIQFVFGIGGEEKAFIWLDLRKQGPHLLEILQGWVAVKNEVYSSLAIGFA